MTPSLSLGVRMSDDSAIDKKSPLRQVPLPLTPNNPHSLSYFVRHTGVAVAAAAIEDAIDLLAADGSAFRAIFLYGPAGTGKRHLINGSIEQAVGRGISPHLLSSFDLRDADSSVIEKFVGQYDRLKASGGLLLSSAELGAEFLCSNPHLRSRLLAGLTIPVSRPDDSELAAVVRSIAAKQNLNLSEKSISLIVEHLPRDPLSFQTILAKISELCFMHGKSAKLNVVRQAVTGRILGAARD